jgi:hypothetical protein
MSPNLESSWTTWGTVSSGIREIELRGDRLESVGHLAPFLAPAGLLAISSQHHRRVAGPVTASAFDLDPATGDNPAVGLGQAGASVAL